VNRRIVLLAAAVLLAQAPLAHAQAQPPGGAEAGGQGSEPRREALRVVDAYVVSNLQESLGLTDAEYVKVLPLVQKLQASRREHLLARGRLLRQLRRQLRSGSAGEGEIRQTLEELKRVEAEGPERTRKGAAEIDQVLTPLQQAKFRVLELEVEQRLRELMGRARDRGRTPRE
jgi:Spy/CpxP family protein refolding chaperone